MANNATLTSAYPTAQHHCKDCGLYFESGKSLEVHLQYHKENLLSKWATQAQGAQNDVENNNNTKVKREASVAPIADSSDAMITKPSPEFPQRATPETFAPFGHPATPQSYHSAPSPYQTPDPAGFSPGQFPYGPPPFQEGQWDNQQGQYPPDFSKTPRFHPYGGPMVERTARVSSASPLYGQPLSQPTPSPSPKQCDKCGFVCDSAAQLSEHCSTSHPPTPRNSHFQQPQGYPQKPFNNFTTGESENKIKEEQEESADILDLDSQKVVHPGGEEPQFDNSAAQIHHNGPNPHPVSAMLPWPEQKLYNQPQMNGDPKMYAREKVYSDSKLFPIDQKIYSHEHKVYTHDQKLFPGPHDNKNFIHQDPKLYPTHQMPIGEYPSNVSAGRDLPSYRPFDPNTGPQITSNQAQNQSNAPVPQITGKGANWKSNEARRPKTYNCTACNKWFTSSGHLKRHYNTTLHKNAVRSSGQPDPATLPISTHHHPARDPTRGSQQQNTSDPNTQSPISSDDVRSPEDGHGPSQFAPQSFERVHGNMGSTAKGTYMHQQPNIGNNQLLGNNPLANHPLPHQMGTHPLAMGNPPPGIGNPLDTGHHSQTLKPAIQPSSVSNSVGSPPNGQAGPSVQQNHLSRGLLSITTNNSTIQPLVQVTPPITAHSLPPFSHLPASPYSPRASDHPIHTHQDPLYLGQNFQQTLGPNYPNGMAPHVMDTASNSLRITNLVTIGEDIDETFGMVSTDVQSSGPLPSFSQFQSHRYIVPDYSPIHNVGGSVPGDSPTAPTYMLLENAYPFSQTSTEGGDDSSVGNNSSHTELSDHCDLVSPDGEKPYPVMAYRSVIVKLETNQVSNKENFEARVKSPVSPIKSEYSDSPSVAIIGTNLPLTSSNNKQARQRKQPKQPKPQPVKAASNVIYKCVECDKLFNRACYLTQHNKSFHSGVKPFKCGRCGKRFPDGDVYQQHYAKHAGDKPFKCEQCPKQFNHKTDLRRHMCLHTGEKPFSCAECGKGFIRKDHMIKHSETHRKKPAALIST